MTIGSTGSDSSNSLKLPACERCRVRKVKCDTAIPKCTPCKRSDSACIIVDSTTSQRYSRNHVADLEQKLRLLEANVKSPGSTLSVRSPSDVNNPRATNRHFVGDGSGLNFFKRLSTAARTRLPLGDDDAGHSQTSPYDSWAIAPHALPSQEVAAMLVGRYTNHAQLHHPLLSRSSVSQLVNRVYAPSGRAASAEDMYRIFMVFAISSVTTYRRGQTQEHPYGWFHSAQQYAKQVDFVGSISGIQNLLLVARFAMYYQCQLSIWDIARACIRQCIALGLHRPPKARLSPLDEQARLNLFWDCYVHDRFSSGVLGRPYAIAEEDITVDLPVEISEEKLASLPIAHLDQATLAVHSIPNEASVFRFVVRLRRAITRISTFFYSSNGHLQQQYPRWSVSDAGQVRLSLNRFLKELQKIRESAPVFPNPQSLYERPEWYDYLVEKDKLTLIRGAMARMPVEGLHPPRSLLDMALESAIRVIERYHSLFSKGQITWTRSYFQILFTSGLSIMYVLSILKQVPSDLSDPAFMFTKASGALNIASEMMQKFVTEMPDSHKFAMVFAVLVRQYTGADTGTHARPSRATTPPLQGQHVHKQRADNVAVNAETPGTAGRLHTSMHPPALDQGVRSSHLLIDQSLNTVDTDQQMHQHDTLPGGVLPEMMPSIMQPMQQDYDFALELGLDDFHNWSLHPHNDSILGQVEAGLGEYAWGMPPDDSLWNQWDIFRDPG